MHILIVDDDQEDVELFIEVIRDIDRTAVCSSICRYATLEDELKNIAMPDLIFVDGHLGPMTGKESLHILNKMIDPEKTKIIIHTGGVVTAQEEEEYRKLGASGILTKGTLYSQIRENFVAVIKSLANPDKITRSA